MIKKLIIKGFEAHKNSVFNFSTGINVITGKSDVGKSSIRRALEFVIENKNTSDSFINFESDKIEVIIEDDDSIIKRIKGKSDNTYYLDEKKYTAFGRDVPDDIKNKFNFDIFNIQKQFDKHFLLSVSPGEAGKVLNKIVNLDSISETLSLIERDKRVVTKNKRIQEENVKSIASDMESYTFLKDFEKKLRKAERKKNKLSEIICKINNIKSIVSGYNNLITKEHTFSKLDFQLDKIKEAEKLQVGLSLLNSKIELIKFFIKNENSLCVLENEISLLVKDIQKIKVCPLCEQRINYEICG